MKTIINFIDADLVNGIVYLMVGHKDIELTVEKYRELVGYSQKWNSGLEKKGTTFKFIEKNATRVDGLAMARNIKKILSCTK